MRPGSSRTAGQHLMWLALRWTLHAFVQQSHFPGSRNLLFATVSTIHSFMATKITMLPKELRCHRAGVGHGSHAGLGRAGTVHWLTDFGYSSAHFLQHLRIFVQQARRMQNRCRLTHEYVQACGGKRKPWPVLQLLP